MAAEPPRLEAGLSAHGECDANGYCSWFPPEDADGGSAGLMVNNTLVRDRKVPLKPRDGRRLLWYTCGPTVYDVAHMGHARAYLTFDILRRILEDYFGYEVVYQVNITDIDDKIIRRARQNHLFERYVADDPDLNRVIADCNEVSLAFGETVKKTTDPDKKAMQV